jgi:hypothetical protein
MVASFKIAAAGAVMSASLAVASPLAAETTAPLAAEFSAASVAVANVAEAPQLSSINYERLYRRLVQAGMLSQVLHYTLSVDAEGKPVECSFSRDFRMLVTEREVCRSFLRSVTFEPARDAQGNPVAGRYQGEIEIASFFQPNR